MRDAPEARGARAAAPRILELDALRGIAALAVVLYHYTTRYGEKVGHDAAPVFSVPFGHYGVELFFLLSGFVIYMTLERTRRGRDFVLSRATRLYPTYWVGLLVTLTLVALLGKPFAGYGVTAYDIATNLTMLQRYAPGAKDVDGVYWTLGVELTFYGWMLALLLSGRLARVRTAIALLLVAELGLHWATRGGDISAPLVLRVLRKGLLEHFGPYFGAGIVFYRLSKRAPTAPLRADLLLLAACWVAIAWMRPRADLVASTVCFGVFAALSAGWLRALACRPLLVLGAVSYPLYVVHQNVGFLVIRHMTAAGVDVNLAIGLALALSLSLATAIMLWVERPALALLRARLHGRRAQAAATAGSVREASAEAAS